MLGVRIKAEEIEAKEEQTETSLPELPSMKLSGVMAGTKKGAAGLLLLQIKLWGQAVPLETGRESRSQPFAVCSRRYAGSFSTGQQCSEPP